MSHPWACTTDVDAAVRGIRRVLKKEGGLPWQLVEAYRGILLMAKPEHADRFHQVLADLVPEAVAHFPRG
jgi:hypothetical protein